MVTFLSYTSMPFVQWRVLTFEHSYDAIGLSGLCWMSALVSALAYGFVLELVPDVREASDGYPTMKTVTSVAIYVSFFCSEPQASLEDIETLFADTARFKRFNWKGEDERSDDEESVI